MRRFLLVVLGVAIGGGAVFGAYHYHIVRTDKQFLFVPRQTADWHDCFADVRQWDGQKWREHPQLTQDMIAAGHGDAVARSAAGGFFNNFLGSFREKAPQPRSARPQGR